MFDDFKNIFDNSFVRIFGILIGVVYLFYQFQLWGVLSGGFKNWKKREEEFEAEKIKFSKPPDESDYFPETGLKSEVKLLKIIKSDNRYQVYFSIIGNTIAVKDIISNDIKSISFDPKGTITNDTVARLGFTKIYSENNLIRFKIIFEDKFNAIHSKQYLLSISENNLIEME